MSSPKEYQKSNVQRGELAAYKVLSNPAVQARNDSFLTLILPRAIKVDISSATLLLPHYDGETFDTTWNTTNGGAAMDTSLAYALPLLLQDLATIEPAVFTDNDLLKQLPNLAFNHENAVQYFGDLSSELARTNILSDLEHDKITHLLSHWQTTKLIINNGDFYPRNLIRQSDGKLILIDWEAWNPHSPFFLVDHPENVAAVQYVHMWGNPEWQAIFRAELEQRFAFESTSFDKGIIMKALTLASFFRKHETLFDGQLTILKQLLSGY